MWRDFSESRCRLSRGSWSMIYLSVTLLTEYLLNKVSVITRKALSGSDTLSSSRYGTINRRSQTVNRQPSTVNRHPSTVNYRLSTVNRQPSTIDHRPSTVNCQSSIVNRQPSTVNRQLSTINHYHDHDHEDEKNFTIVPASIVIFHIANLSSGA
jgi:hypothetical protein